MKAYAVSLLVLDKLALFCLFFLLFAHLKNLNCLSYVGHHSSLEIQQGFLLSKSWYSSCSSYSFQMPILFSILIITFNFTHIHFNPCCSQASIINHISSISATPPSSLNPDIDETSVILFFSCSNFLIIFIWNYTSKLFTFNY